MIVDGPALYVTGTSQLYVYNISTPTGPSHLANLLGIGQSKRKGALLPNQYLYLVNSYGIEVVNIVDPLYPHK